MKIVHISTSDKGGAGIAAVRLHNALLSRGVDSSFLSLFDSGRTEALSCFVNIHERKTSYLQRLRRKIGLPNSIAEKNANILKSYPSSYEIFSFPYSDYQVEEHPLIQEADIIHLHWVSGFINYPSFFKSIKKPIVWTLHDMNPFLGGFHYLGDKQLNEKKMGGLEKSLTQVKENIYNFKELNIITPSVWMSNHVKESILKNQKQQVIYYSLDMSVFKIQSRMIARKHFNLPEHKKILLFVSQDNMNFRKGFDILLESIKKLELGNDIVLVSVGANNSQINIHKNCICINTINDEKQMSLLYAAADLYILPSREDNLPNVMLESLACGTPVISFSNGGMNEIIKDGFNGFIAEECNANSLSIAILKGLQNINFFNRKEIREDAEIRFSPEVQSSAYLNLYKQIL